MKEKLKKVLDAVGVKGRVRNHSSKYLWVIETTSKANAVAHLLAPGFKSPSLIDADGFKRFDGKAIDGHHSWWKILTVSTADIVDNGNDLLVYVAYKVKVLESEFGHVEFNFDEAWGKKMHYISAVKKGKDNTIKEYFVKKYGWLSRSKAVGMVKEGHIDNAVVVNPKRGRTYLRSYPGRPNFNIS